MKHRKETGENGILVAPFDTELFGHWWFEGPEFLYHVCKWVDADPDLQPVTGGEMLQIKPPTEIISIPEGSWGEGGYHYIWLNKWTEWTWKHIYECEHTMTELATRHADSADETLQRLLKQLARELLMLESSDWQFLISTWSARDYAESRITVHFEGFNRMSEIIENYLRDGSLAATDLTYLEDLESRDPAFAHVNPKLWAKTNA